jgi:hypothetical protein
MAIEPKAEESRIGLSKCLPRYARVHESGSEFVCAFRPPPYTSQQGAARPHQPLKRLPASSFAAMRLGPRGLEAALLVLAAVIQLVAAQQPPEPAPPAAAPTNATCPAAPVAPAFDVQATSSELFLDVAGAAGGGSARASRWGAFRKHKKLTSPCPRAQS